MSMDVGVTASANLDAAGNIKTNLPLTASQAGYVRTVSENDPGTLTGVPFLKSSETSQDYRLRVGTDTVLFTDSFNATAQNTYNWFYTFSTLTAAQPGAGTVNFSNVQGTITGNGAIMRSYQYFPLIGTAPLSVEFTAGMVTAPLVANEIWLMGLSNSGAVATIPAEGVWFQLTSAGLIGVAAYNNTFTQTGTLLPIESINVSEMYKYTMVIGERNIDYYINDQHLGSLAIPAANGQPFQSTNLPLFMQKYNTGSVSNTNTMRVSDVTVSLMDIATNMPWAHQAALAGLSGTVAQNGSGMGQTALWTNNGVAGGGPPSNTAVLATGLGGLYVTTCTIAANTDGNIFSYQNPVTSVNTTSRNLIVTGIRFNGVVTTAITGGPCIFAYALAYGHTGVSLATTETTSFANNTTHGPRRVPLGIESYGAAATVGTVGAMGGTTINFNAPIVVRPGEFIAFTYRNIGTAATAGAIAHLVGFDSYWS